MTSKHELPIELRNRPFSVREAETFGLSRLKITRLKSEGILQSIEPGIYAADGYELRPEDPFRISALRLGTPSAICLLSALSFHGYGNKPERIWVLVPQSKRTISENYVLLRSRNPHWKIGIEQRDGFKVTDLERTIVDCLIYRSLVEPRISMEALRKMGTRKGAIPKVLEMGERLEVAHRIRPYLEVLS